MYNNDQLPQILATMPRRDLSDFERGVSYEYSGFKGCVCVCLCLSHQISTQLNTWEILEEWCRIPPIEFQTLVESMPRCIEAVVAAHGGPIKCPIKRKNPPKTTLSFNLQF
jgi:hypothetical protein